MTAMMVRIPSQRDPFEDALCRGETTSRFFPDDYELPDPSAIALCQRCPIQEFCAQWGIDHDEVGIWGGLTDEDRRKLNTQRSRVKCPSCGSRAVNTTFDDKSEVCISCGVSWPI